MPLAVGVLTPTTPTPTPTDPGPIVPTVPEVGTMRATWTDPDGGVWELTGPHELHGWLTTQGIGGWGATPRTFVVDPLARGGVSVRHIRTEPRRITWPLNVYGSTYLEFMTRYRGLMRAFMLTAQTGRPGVLTVYLPDGSGRSIEAFCEEGWAGQPGENHTFANPVLTLLCPDGYWRDIQPRVVTRQYQENTGPFLAPYMRVSSGQVLGDTTITNPGDVPGWPLWTITGPATSVTATNNTTGAAFTLTFTLAVGEQVTIDTSSHRPTVRGPAGQNLVGALNWPGADLWALAPGVNNVNFSVDGADAGTTIEMRYHPRYEAA
ncbi:MULTISPECIES: phage distal tail protein [unclassified Micromonospora]|uniref:phage distal tail protein n=1 Tax=unclassified Micromonospora TaxID=2617518 RepID=UPI00332D02AB